MGTFLAFGPWACGGDDSNSGGSGPTTSTTTTSAVSTTATGTISCEGALNFGQACTPCLEQSCCAEVSACAGDPDCYDCLTGNGGPECDGNAAADGLLACAQAECNAECFLEPAVECNPVTGASCDVAHGASCDIANDGGFTCYPTGNTHLLCEECGGTNPEFCQAGLTCLTGVCMKYCCDDGDCGTGVCEKGYYHAPDAPVGVCITAGSDPMAPMAACDAPVPSPSNGSCVVGTGGGGGAGGAGAGGAGGN
jgi:hypothetical protein